MDRKPKHNALVASAALLSPERKMSPEHDSWQEEAWGFYDIGEALYYGATWFGNGLSRARLVAATAPAGVGDNPQPLEEGPAADIVAGLAGGIAGQARMMKSFGVHLTVAGQCFLVAETDVDTGGTSWQVLSADELQTKGGKFQCRDEVTASWRDLSEESLVSKVWRPHERYHWKADSPTRHVLPALREFARASEQLEATLVSRLAGAGVYWIPSEATFPRPEGADPEGDPFAQHLIQVASTAIKDRGSAAAVTPLVARMKADLIEKVRLDTFDSAVDDKAVALRESAIRRVATGLDMPPEVLLGLADVNHWSGWLIQESGVQWHIEPSLELICHALTISYLHPALEAAGVKDPELYTVWFDVTELTTRPDRSDDAFKAYDRMELSGTSLRRETGFNETDAPDEEEIKRQAYFRMLGSVTNALTGMEGLGFVPPGTAAAAAAARSGGPAADVEIESVDAAAPGADKDEPGTGAQSEGPPKKVNVGDIEATANMAATVAAFPMAYRALERAGNRARTKMRADKVDAGKLDCPAGLLHTRVPLESYGLRLQDLMAGTADESTDVAARLGLDAGVYAGKIKVLVASLIRSQRPLTWEALEEAMEADLG